MAKKKKKGVSKTGKIIVDKYEPKLNCKYIQCQWNKFYSQKTKVTKPYLKITIPNYIKLRRDTPWIWRQRKTES